jgi:hypothetical protein
MAPIGIRYYRLYNQGAAIIIWHKLLGVNGTVVWDTRYQGGNADSINIGTALPISSVNSKLTHPCQGHNQTLDFASTSIGKDVYFYLSEDTFWGVDFTDNSQSFYYDPNSRLVASATRTGSVDIGELTYQGVKENSFTSSGTPESSLATSAAVEDTLRQLGVLDTSLGKSYSGSVSWPNTDAAAKGLATILVHLASKGHKLNYTASGTNAFVEFGPSDENAVASAEDGERDWEEALSKASIHQAPKGSFSLVAARG